MESNKKVLFVATITGHINAFHIPYLKLFKDKGWETHVATGDNLQVTDCCDKKIFVPIARSPYKLSNLKAIKELKKIIDKEKYDIIHCHTPMGAVVARLAAKKARKKYGTRVIYTAHGFHFYKGAPLLNWLLFYPVEWYLAKYTDTLITINKEDYERAKRKFGKRCKDIQYVPGVGIDTKKFDIKMTEREKNEYRKSLGLSKNDFVLTFVARLDKNKNQGFLINMMNELIKKKSNIHLLLVGKDEYNGYYQDLVKKQNLNKNIHIFGYRKDIPQIMEISNIIVSSSLREGLPVNILEALASGLPVVVLNCRGMEDLIVNDEEGYIVERNDLSTFVNKILNLSEDKQLYNRIYKNNKNIVNNYSLNSVIKNVRKIYFKDDI